LTKEDRHLPIFEAQDDIRTSEVHTKKIVTETTAEDAILLIEVRHDPRTAEAPLDTLTTEVHQEIQTTGDHLDTLTTEVLLDTLTIEVLLDTLTTGVHLDILTIEATLDLLMIVVHDTVATTGAATLRMAGVTRMIVGLGTTTIEGNRMTSGGDPI
jgi:hypothetical protein